MPISIPFRAVCNAWAAVRARGRRLAAPLLRHRRETPLPCRPLVVAAAALAAGCWLGRVVEPAPTMSFAAGWWAASVAAVAGWWLVRRHALPWVPAAALVAAIAALGASWSAARFDLFSRDDLAWQLTDVPLPVAVTATVVESFRRVPTGDDPRRAAAIGPSSECVVAVHARRSGSRWRAAVGRATVVVDGDPPDVGVGDRIRILGRGLRPASAGNPGEFDFRVRARAGRCLSVIRVGSARGIRRLESAASLWPAGWLDRLRVRGLHVLESHVSPAHFPLASALLLGSRESLPRAAADDFLATGTVHILSISGLHVGLLALALFATVRALSLPRGWALVLVAAVTGGYMLLVRAETPVVRATLLVWLSCLAAAVGRRSPAINGLAVAAIIVLALRPADVLSSGAQLSFLSTAVLVGVASVLASSRRSPDPIERLIDRSRSPLERLVRRLGGECRMAFLAGAAVWAATAPLVASRFHVVSPVGLVVNVLVAPLVALAMGWGFLCLLASCVSATVAGWCGAACDGMLACISVAVHWSARVPGGHWWVAGPPDWWVAGWYAALLAMLGWCRPESLRRIHTWAAVAAAWCGVGMVAETATLVAARPAGLRGVVAAVGHGCGVVFTSPTGRTLVFDAGRLGAPASARRSLSALLWSERTRTIDHLVISHADVDHFNAVPELLDRFVVGEIVLTDAFLASDAPAARDLVAEIRRRGIPVRRVRAGDSFAVDAQCRVRVLHPPPGPASGTDNEASVVLAVEAAGRRWLLTGDLEGPAAARFVADDPDTCDVLLAPHHGSATSLPPDVAAATRPQVVVVSGAETRSWPLVREAYASAAGGAEVLATARDGAIAIEADAARLAVSRFRGGRWRREPGRSP
ncbi:MAG: ComEC/Rec2 family competence protein [Planctomycetaceae bacterium]